MEELKKSRRQAVGSLRVTIAAIAVSAAILVNPCGGLELSCNSEPTPSEQGITQQIYDSYKQVTNPFFL